MFRRLGHLRLALGSLALFASAGCGGRTEAPAPPSLVKLVHLPEAEVRPAPRDGEPEARVLLGSDSAAWSLAEDALEPYGPRSGAITATTGSEGETDYLSLSGTRGGAFGVVAVEPFLPIRFRGRVRARGLTPVDPTNFHGARLALTELGAAGAADGVLDSRWAQHIEHRHYYPTVVGDGDWLEVDDTLQMGESTRWLVVGLDLGFLEPVAAGRVDFAGVEVTAPGWLAHWRRAVPAAARTRHPGDPAPAGWRAERLTSVSLGHELRPSIVCLPGESITFRTTVPGGDPVFRAGVGPWEASLPPHAGEKITFHLRARGAAGAVEWQHTVTVPAHYHQGSWAELELPLPFSGQEVDLELSVEGAGPGAWGSPELVNRVARPSRPNVILVSIDTLRADHLGMYGYPLDTTPVLDEWAKSALVFEDMTAQAPYTLPSHVTMFSGQFPSVHGVQSARYLLSSRRTPLLGEILGGRGYHTRAFTGGVYVSRDFGFDRGFDGFTEVDPIQHRGAAVFEDWVRRDPEHMPAALADRLASGVAHRWLREEATEPFFLFVHTYQVHEFEAPEEDLALFDEGCDVTWDEVRSYLRGAYHKKEPLTPERLAHLRHCYDAALHHVDRKLGELFAILDERGLTERTIVVVTSDHGKEILEHGDLQHGISLYEELTRIPLLVFIPGVTPGRVTEPAMLVDVAPTVLAALGLPADPRMQGHDLLARGGRAERVVWSEVDASAKKFALRDEEGWKLIHGPPEGGYIKPNPRPWELYHLGGDPREAKDLSADETARLARMQDRLLETRALLEELGASMGEIGEGELDAETIEKLQRLGYADNDR